MEKISEQEIIEIKNDLAFEGKEFKWKDILNNYKVSLKILDKYKDDFSKLEWEIISYKQDLNINFIKKNKLYFLDNLKNLLLNKSLKSVKPEILNEFQVNEVEVMNDVKIQMYILNNNLLEEKINSSNSKIEDNSLLIKKYEDEREVIDQANLDMKTMLELSKNNKEIPTEKVRTFENNVKEREIRSFSLTVIIENLKKENEKLETQLIELRELNEQNKLLIKNSKKELAEYRETKEINFTELNPVLNKYNQKIFDKSKQIKDEGYDSIEHYISTFDKEQSMKYLEIQSHIDRSIKTNDLKSLIEAYKSREQFLSLYDLTKVELSDFSDITFNDIEIKEEEEEVKETIITEEEILSEDLDVDLKSLKRENITSLFFELYDVEIRDWSDEVSDVDAVVLEMIQNKNLPDEIKLLIKDTNIKPETLEIVNKSLNDINIDDIFKPEEIEKMEEDIKEKKITRIRQ